MYFVKCELIKENVANYPAYEQITDFKKLYEVATKALKLDKAAEEYFYCIHTDVKNQIIGIHEVSHGSLTESIVHPREVFKAAILNNAVGVFLVHNHPSGDTAPSTIDIDTTNRLKEAGKILGIVVLDHIIVGSKGYTSMLEKNLLWIDRRW